MKIEVLIYAYLAICTAMIGFNIVSVFVNRETERQLKKSSLRFTGIMTHMLEYDCADENHCRYLVKRLKRLGNLMAFERVLLAFYTDEPQKAARYLRKTAPAFVQLLTYYSKKSTIQCAYFLYIIGRYRIFENEYTEEMQNTVIGFVRNDSFYCRENAMEAVYASGSSEMVVKALLVLGRSGYYHSRKLITDGLLAFAGDKETLETLLWQKFDDFPEDYRVGIIDYFRLSAGAHHSRVLALMKDETAPREVRYACIRYFKSHFDADAYEALCSFLEKDDRAEWEYVAIAALAMSTYPGEETNAKLKALLHSRNWYVRYNASQSLEELGVQYRDLIDIFEGNDRYAGEIMRYRLDRKKLKERTVAEDDA